MTAPTGWVSLQSDEVISIGSPHHGLALDDRVVRDDVLHDPRGVERVVPIVASDDPIEDFASVNCASGISDLRSRLTMSRA